VTGFGWRACFLFIACVGVANLVFASVALKPDPVSHSNKTLKGVLVASRQSLSQLANWGCAMTFASHFAVVTTLSGVWGIPMVAHFFNISPSAASTPLLSPRRWMRRSTPSRRVNPPSIRPTETTGALIGKTGLF